MHGAYAPSMTSWRQLGPNEKQTIAALGTVQVGLQAAALWDLRRRPRQEVRGPRPLWAAASFVNFLGPLAYFVFGRRRHR